jgi:hypothetical protein
VSGATNKIIPWERENPKRGASSHDLALAFIEDFPIGSQLSQDRFGQWLQHHNLLVTAPRGSIGRGEYTSERKKWRGKINNAASHSRMNAAINATFTISLIAQETLEVRDCLVALATTDNVRPIELHAKARRRQMNHWAAGIDWSKHSPHVYDSACLLFKFTETLRKHAEISHKDYCEATAEFTGYLHKLKFLPAPVS